MNNLSILPNDNPDDPPPPPRPTPKWAVIEALAKDPTYTKVKVIDFEMSFSSMVWFMVKFAIAAIPAALILFALGMFLIAAAGHSH